MTLNEIIENENIRSDRYAMAAISCIFKAFGDNIRSKEYWPWGKDVQCEWYSSKGTKLDVTEAELLLERALEKYEEENSGTTNEYINLIDDDMDNNYKKQIKALKRRINKVVLNMKTVNKTNTEIENISNNTNTAIDSI